MNNQDLRRNTPDLSRREVLQIFAAGVAGAVGTIALDRASRSNLAGASNGGILRIAWLTPAQLEPALRIRDERNRCLERAI